METIVLMIAAVMPFAVQKTVELLKTVPVLAWSGHRVMWIRALVGVLSLLGAVLTFMVGGHEVDASIVENAILGIFTASVATLQYLNSKK